MNNQEMAENGTVDSCRYCSAPPASHYHHIKPRSQRACSCRLYQKLKYRYTAQIIMRIPCFAFMVLNNELQESEIVLK
jgi:hypothetical protein